MKINFSDRTNAFNIYILKLFVLLKNFVEARITKKLTSWLYKKFKQLMKDRNNAKVNFQWSSRI